MMKLKKFVLFGLILSVLLISGCSSAANANDDNAFTKVITMQYLVDVGLLQSPISALEGFIRILLFITLFSIIFTVGKLVLAPGPSVAVAAVISLMSTVFIPSSILVFASASYALIVSLILILIPVGITVFLYFEVKKGWLRFLLLGLLLFLVWQMHSYISNLVGQGAISEIFPDSLTSADTLSGFVNALSAVEGWLVAVIVFLILAMVASLFGLFGGSAKGAAGAVGDAIKSRASRLFGKGGNDEHEMLEEEARESQVAQRAEREEKFAIEEFTELEEMKKVIEGYSGDSIKGLSNAVGKVLSKAKRTEARYYSRLQNLVNRINKLKLSDKKKALIVPKIAALKANSQSLLKEIAEFNRLLGLRSEENPMGTIKQNLILALNEAIKWVRAETEGLQEIKKILKKELA